MKQLKLFTCTMCFIVMFKFSFAQIVTVTGGANTTPSLSSSYTSLANAITDLNSITAIRGPVLITLNPGNSEVAPAGGYEINFSATTSESNNIVIDGSSSYDTIISSPSLTSGSITDAVFKLIGCDFVTIKRFTIIENSSNTTTTLGTNNMTEWGIALLRGSTSDGAQSNTIEDNNISLSRSYQNSFGIYSNVRHSATAPSTSSAIVNGTTAPNHYNKIYNNRISNVSMGIAFIGSSTDSRMDNGNDIGGNSSSSGNKITNWGGNALVDASFTGNLSEYYGSLIRCQKNVNISWNEITSSTSLSGTSAAQISGIRYGNSTGTVTGSFTISILNNTITITDNLPNGSSSVSGVNGISIADKLATGSLYVNNNIISGLAVTIANSNRQIRGITSSASASNVYINNNTIKGNTTTATDIGGWFIGIDQTGSVDSTLEINENNIGDSLTSTPAITFSSVAHGSAVVRGISNVQTSNTTGTASVSINKNRLYGFIHSSGSSNSHTYILCNHTTSTNSNFEIEENEFINITANISGDVRFIHSQGAMASFAGAHLSVSNNKIVGTFSKSLSGGNVYLYHAAGNSSTGNSMIESGNDFSNITLTGTTLMRGWYNNEGVSAAGPEKSIVNNVFENWICGTSGTGTTNAIYCNWASGNSEVSKNRISNITAPASLNGILSASEDADSLAFNGNSLIDLKSSGNGYEIAMFKFSGISSDMNIINTFASAVGAVGSPSRYDVITFPIIEPEYENIYVYYNTIYLDVSSANSNFSSNAIYFASSSDPDECRLFLRNNIIVNVSQPNGTGISAAYGRSGVSLANFDQSSNNNVFYAGPTPSAQHVIFSDGTNFAQTLSDYQTHLQTNGFPASTEQASLWLLPEFVAPVATNPDLHLVSPSTINCLIKNAGDNNGIYLNNDVDGDWRMWYMPYTTSIGADEVSKTNIWLGYTYNWDDPNNWSLGIVPNSTEMSVLIRAYYPNRVAPLIETGETYQVENIVVEEYMWNNGLLKIAGHSNSLFGWIFNINSSFEVTGSLEFNGYCQNQIITPTNFINPSNWLTYDVNNLIISSDVEISTNNLNVHGELSFGTSTNTTLTTNGNLTLVSNANRTANVAQIDNSNFIDGDVTVERYINTGTGSGQHSKKWQALATPTGANSTSQSVYDSWMEGGNNSSTGYGTHIPDPRTDWAARGFDGSSTTTSIQTYNPSTNGFDPIANTSINLTNSNGYFIFVRGDRSIDEFTSFPNQTNMRSKGALFQPQSGYQPPSVTVPAGDFQLVGNPYASAIDIQYMINNSYFTNLNNNVTVWDPLLPGALGLGGYQTISPANSYMPVPGGTTLYDASQVYTEIQSGQAFFVKSPSVAGSVTFDEEIKTSNYRLVTKQPSNATRKFFRTKLYSEEKICDGTVLVFDEIFDNLVDYDDAGKLLNPSENFMILRNGKQLSIEARTEVVTTDTVYYTFANLNKKTYTLGFAPVNFEKSNIEAVLIDNYLKTRTFINLFDSSFVVFSIDDSKSSYENRFMVIFTNANGVESPGIYSQFPNEFESSNLVVFPNPVENGKLNFRFNNDTEGLYSVKLISSTGQLVYQGTLSVSNKVGTTSINIVQKLAKGSYELILIDSKGKSFTRKVIFN